jgi:putative PIN family toxin of toxin-antitoxin system
LRIVIATNVIISGIFWIEKPKVVLNLARDGIITAVTCRYLMRELFKILISKDKPFKLSRQEARKIIKHFNVFTERIKTKSKISVCRDEADNKVLECAVDGKASYIVTGDNDLLDLSLIIRNGAY